MPSQITVFCLCTDAEFAQSPPQIYILAADSEDWIISGRLFAAEHVISECIR